MSCDDGSWSNLTIFVDMDNTLVDLTGPVLAMYNEEYGDSLKSGDIVEYGMWQFMKCGKDKLYSYFNVPGLFRHLTPLPDAIRAVQELIRADHRVFIATSPPYSALDSMREKKEWVDEHLPELRRNVVFLREKSLLRGDVLIDDTPKNLKGFYGTSVCFGMPYNEGCGDFRVDSWDELLRLFRMKGGLK